MPPLSSLHLKAASLLWWRAFLSRTPRGELKQPSTAATTSSAAALAMAAWSGAASTWPCKTVPLTTTPSGSGSSCGRKKDERHLGHMHMQHVHVHVYVHVHVHVHVTCCCMLYTCIQHLRRQAEARVSQAAARHHVVLGFWAAVSAHTAAPARALSSMGRPPAAPDPMRAGGSDLLSRASARSVRLPSCVSASATCHA